MMSPQRETPGPGQESVWDYPRPPRLEDTSKKIRIIFNRQVLVETQNAKRVLETSHPPAYYIPPGDIQMQFLLPTSGTSYCEWKGQAVYFDVLVGDQKANRAAWSYPNPIPPFGPIKDYIAFYPVLMDQCTVDGEIVKPQPGGFYGGWITKDIVGPFKGGPGTMGW